MKNIDIRTTAAAAKVRLWQVAERVGVSEGTFCRKLRRELPAEEKARVLAAIQALAAEAQE